MHTIYVNVHDHRILTAEEGGGVLLTVELSYGLDAYLRSEFRSVEYLEIKRCDLATGVLVFRTYEDPRRVLRLIAFDLSNIPNTSNVVTTDTTGAITLLVERITASSNEPPTCMNCRVVMVRAGRSYVCSSCGKTLLT